MLFVALVCFVQKRKDRMCLLDELSSSLFIVILRLDLKTIPLNLDFSTSFVRYTEEDLQYLNGVTFVVAKASSAAERSVAGDRRFRRCAGPSSS